MSDLEIHPIQPTEDPESDLNPLLPTMPFIITLFAPRGGGKSTIISNLVLKKEFYYGRFDVVYIMSNTIYNDKTSRFLKKKYKKTIFPKYNDSVIEAIMDEQRIDDSDNEEGQDIKVLLILDDILGEMKPNSKIWSLLPIHRHLNVSLIFAGQIFRGHGFSPLLRNNLTAAIILKTTNQKEIDKMEEEFSGFTNFRKMLDYATSERYSFLYLNLERQFAMKNFTQMLWDSREKKNENTEFKEETDEK